MRNNIYFVIKRDPEKAMNEIKIVKIQQRPTGSFMVTIPNEIVSALGIVKGNKVKVLLDAKSKRFVYELLGSEKI